MTPFSTCGGCVAVHHDVNHLNVHTCLRPRGGDITAGAPSYSLSATNDGVADDLFEDENGVVVVDDALESLILNA